MTLIRFLFYLFVVSAAFHFSWEVSQMPLFTSLPLSVWNHWIFAIKDAGVVVALYLVVGLLVRNGSWGKRLNHQRFLFFVFLGFAWAVGIEYHAVFVAQRWAYTSAMPLIPVLNVGLVPVLQMMVLPLIALLAVRRQLVEK